MYMSVLLEKLVLVCLHFVQGVYITSFCCLTLEHDPPIVAHDHGVATDNGQLQAANNNTPPSATPQLLLGERAASLNLNCHSYGS